MKPMKSVLVATFIAATAVAASAYAAGPNDAQIAAIVVAANQVDIDAGKLAQSKASSKEVRNFAKTMVADHTGVNKQAVDLVTKLNVKPEENDTSKSLKGNGQKTLADLKKLKGAAFDRAYVDNEVKYHQAVLDAVDQVLIPNAQNQELHALLVKVRPAFVAHLDHAKQIQASIEKKS